MRKLIRRWLTPAPSVTGMHQLINSTTLDDDVLGRCTRGSGDDATFEASIVLDSAGPVPVTFFADEPLDDTLAYVRAILSALPANDARYRRYAAADVRQFQIALGNGNAPIPVAEFASRMRLSHIVVYYPTSEEGATLWYTCDNLIPNALVCVTLDENRRFVGGGIG
ncbi:hypothetical protein LOC67_22665 [Stieleria sp. JC731]|uniref:hypothetical protein n=1 Tax=Stieleria sp. JC731 TaxID=2894195 RepID=UPI001E4F5C1B|nr:hypothetical protein [Stieleria sp. JC731]MCC9603362.1 hypothetical protein [Stieleria sp. JC731]